MFDSKLSKPVNAVFKAGPIPPVMILTQRVIGSRRMSVRLPNNAARRIAARTKIFPALQVSGIGFLVFRLFLNGKKSSIVPIGQIQPHQALPNMKVSAMTARLRSMPTVKILLAIACASARSGLNSTGKRPARMPQVKPAVVVHRISHKNRKRN